jgi:hypothetical protein
MSNIIHGQISDMEKIVLEDLGRVNGKVNYDDFMALLYKRYGQIGAIQSQDAITILLGIKFIDQKGKNLIVTNRGWAVLEGSEILSSLKKTLSEGELYADYVDGYTPCFIFTIKDSDYTVDVIERVVYKAIDVHKGNAKNPIVQSELPLSPSWLIIYE